MDPVRKDNGVADISKLRRPMGEILIQWDPNTQQLGFRIVGLTAVEEVGLLQWLINLRMAGHLNLNQSGQVKIVSPEQMPPPPKVS